MSWQKSMSFLFIFCSLGLQQKYYSFLNIKYMFSNPYKSSELKIIKPKLWLKPSIISHFATECDSTRQNLPPSPLRDVIVSAIWWWFRVISKKSLEAAKMAAAKKRGEKEENETCCSKKDKGLEKRIIRQWKFSGGKKVLSWDFRELAKTRLTGFWTHIKK